MQRSVITKIWRDSSFDMNNIDTLLTYIVVFVAAENI